MAAFAYEPETAENKALQKEVQLKLRDHLGPTYNDDILPLCAPCYDSTAGEHGCRVTNVMLSGRYIVTLLNHGNDETQVALNLEEFLHADAKPFATW